MCEVMNIEFNLITLIKWVFLHAQNLNILWTKLVFKLFFKIVRFQTFFQNSLLFHALIICFHKNSYIYWNQSEITEGDK